MIVIKIPADLSPHHIVDIDNDDVLGGLHRVCGCDVVERVVPRCFPGGFAMVVDGEAGLKDNVKQNRVAGLLYGGFIGGDVVIIGETVTNDGIEFCGISPDDIGHWLWWLNGIRTSLL